MGNNNTEDIEALLSGSSDIGESDGEKKIDSAKEEFYSKEREKYLRMEEEFVNLLSSVVTLLKKRNTQKLWFKGVFFAVVMILFFVLMSTPLVLLFKFSDEITDVSIIITIVTSLIEMISAIIVLPKIIAEYLFNKEEEKDTIEMVQNLKAYHENKADRIK